MHKNENRPGYKKTKVGWIPEGWRATTVGGIVDDKTIAKPLDGNHGNIHPKAADFVTSGIPFVMAKDVQNGIVNVDNCACITREQADSLQKGFSKKGDVLLTHKATVGNTAIVEEIKTDYIMLTPQVTYYRVLDTKRLNNRYLRHYFDCCQFQEILAVLAGGGTRSYIGITAQRKLPICYPPLSEQKAIAEVLECWDKGIRTLENKIGKKRLIKKGLMQRLLSGTLRLPGFSKGWKTIRLGDLGEFKTSSVDKKNEPDQEEAYLVNYMDVYRHRFITKKINFQKITATPTEIEKSQIQKGDILFTPSSETPDDIGHSAVVTEDLPKVLQSYHVVRLRIKNDDDLDFNFRGYVFNNADILNTFAHLSTGATRYTLSLGDFKNTQAYIPSDPKEQRAIAEVLAAADGEIEALERKLALWKDQKKFLLNNLVTGTIRLPEFC